MIQTNEPDYRLASDKFCYWLQGFFEMTDADSLTEKQVKLIKEHLALVFTHKVVIPSDPTPPNPPIGTGIKNWPLSPPIDPMVVIC